MTKDQAEAANWRIAATWADGLDLEYAGVSLADCALYPVLSTLNRISLEQIARQQLTAQAS